MVTLSPIRRRIACVALALCLCGVSAGQALASPSDEKQAAALLDEGLMLIEWTKSRPWCVPGVSNGNRARQSLERIVNDCPESRAARVAEYCIPDALVCAGMLDDAIKAADSVILQHPNTTAAAWARLRIGEALARAGVDESGNAVLALREVAGMLPDRLDLGPLNGSRDALGGFCDGFLTNSKDVLDAAECLGLDKADPKARAEVLAIVAAHRGRKGKVGDAVPVLDRLARECPGEVEQINWARCRVAVAYLQANRCQGDFAGTAVKWLRDVPARTGDDLSAEACLWQARYYSVHGPLSQTVSILEDGKERYLDTAHGAEILYGLGCALERSGKHAAAAAAMRDVIKLKAFARFYPTLAEFFIAQQAAPGSPASFVSAMRDAEAHYSPARRFLAYRPCDPILSPGWVTAAQVVSLIREELNEEALRVVSLLPVSANPSAAELLRAKGEVLLCSMRNASTLGRLLSAQPDTVLPLVWPRLDPADAESIQVRYDLLDSARRIVTLADASRCSPAAKLGWLTTLASANAQSGRRAIAIEMYTQALAIPGLSRDEQAASSRLVNTLRPWAKAHFT